MFGTSNRMVTLTKEMVKLETETITHRVSIPKFKRCGKILFQVLDQLGEDFLPENYAPILISAGDLNGDLKDDVVIIDTPPKIESDARPAIEAADLVLIPVAPSPVDFWATEAIIEIAKKAKRKILIQINRANLRSNLISKTNEYINSIDVTATNTLIGHRQIFVASMGEGKTVVEKQRKGKAVDEIKKISEQILLELK